MNVDDIFTSKYIKASDLRGQNISLTIERAEKEKMPDGKKALVLFFAGKDKGLVLNRTNYNTISELLDEVDPDGWQGQKITLYPSETEYGGRMVDCIRVKRKGPSKPAPVQETTNDDGEEIPF